MPALASLAATLAVLLLVCVPVGAPRVDSAVAAPPAAVAPAAPSGRQALLVEGPGGSKPPSVGLQPLPVVPSGPSLEPVALVGPPTAAGPLGIPAIVLAAYQRAAAALAVTQPGCHLPWWLLAGIGQVESGQAEGGRVFPDGTTRGSILGPLLDGHVPGDAIIRDTDGGKLDGNAQFDRAVGPMQFIPSTWARWGADGNADGRKDPNNIFDASLAAARYLCADNHDLATAPGIAAAIGSYNPLPAYLQWVLSWAYGYRDGVISVPVSALPVITDVTLARPPLPVVAARKVRAATPSAKVARAATASSAPPVAALTSRAPSASLSAPPSAPDTPTATAEPTSPNSAPGTSEPTSTVPAAPTSASAGSTACSASASSEPSASSDPSATPGGASSSANPGPDPTGDPSASADGAATSAANPSASADPSAGDTPVRCP